MWGPIVVDLMFRRKWSKDVLDALEVEGCFMVFTWHSMNLFDFGYREDEVMWTMCCEDKHLARVCEDKGVHCLWKVFSVGHIGISTLVAS